MLMLSGHRRGGLRFGGWFVLGIMTEMFAVQGGEGSAQSIRFQILR